MKITTHTRPQGSALLLALLTAFVICIALTTYLYLVSNQNRSVMRSMAWNSSIPVVEAGVEEALTQLNYTAVVNMAANGWSPVAAAVSVVVAAASGAAQPPIRRAFPHTPLIRRAVPPARRRFTKRPPMRLDRGSVLPTRLGTITAVGALGVDGAFATNVRPVSLSRQNTSVKVPPTSMPST